jgi:sulfate permease, SulP family
MNFLSADLKKLITQNWKSGLTVALISVPLSIALSVASGAGPLPGVITGIWATLIAAIFGSNNYNVIGAAGALTTVLFAATLMAPGDLGPAVLPMIAIVSGLIILCVWAIKADRFLYYIPSSIMYGFAAGVAFLIAASQLFDATGLSALKRTGHFIGDVELYIAHIKETDLQALAVFAIFLVAILVWKRYIKFLPAVIPVAIVGIVFGWVESNFLTNIDLITLGDKFGSFKAALVLSVPWQQAPALFSNIEALKWIIGVGGTVALISILETLITAQIADKITKTQSSSRKELFGLALANLGSGAMGGLPATGVFIRTGANIKAGATHKTSSGLAAIFTALIAIVVLPLFIYIPMTVIAALLVNTALGLIETHKFVEFYHREKQSFFIALLVLAITVFEDAGIAVVIGAVVALLFFADRVSHGYFDIVFNYKDGSKKEIRKGKVLTIPSDESYTFVTYSIAGSLGYLDSTRHAANLRLIANSKNIGAVIIRLRNLFSMDFEAEEMLVESITKLKESGKQVYITSISDDLKESLLSFESVKELKEKGRITSKSEEAIRLITSNL